MQNGLDPLEQEEVEAPPARHVATVSPTPAARSSRAYTSKGKGKAKAIPGDSDEEEEDEDELGGSGSVFAPQ